MLFKVFALYSNYLCYFVNYNDNKFCDVINFAIRSSVQKKAFITSDPYMLKTKHLSIYNTHALNKS